MNYKMERIADNVVVITTDSGNTIKIVFSKEDNPDIENIVTDNLYTKHQK